MQSGGGDGVSSAFWLSIQELTRRGLGSGIALAIVAVAVAFAAGLELVARAREVAVASELDQIGPALRVIPYGKTARDLARFELESAPFGTTDLRRLKRELRTSITSVEGRLLLKVPYDDGMLPVVGIDPRAAVLRFEKSYGLSEQSVVVGAELAAEMRLSVGDVLRLQGRSFSVRAVLPQTASEEDSAVLMDVTRLQDLFALPGALNELRIFPASDADVDVIAASVRAHHPEMGVITTHRGETAERAMNATLRSHRHVLYLVTGFLIAASVLIWSLVNSSERRLELATISAVGGSLSTILSMIVARGAILGFSGAVVGFAFGLTICLIQDFESTVHILPAWDIAAVVAAAATLLSGIGALPTALVAAVQDPVRILQEA